MSQGQTEKVYRGTGRVCVVEEEEVDVWKVVVSCKTEKLHFEALKDTELLLPQYEITSRSDAQLSLLSSLELYNFCLALKVTI